MVCAVQLIINQLLGSWAVRNERLALLLRIVNQDLLPAFDSWKAQHVYREQNKRADELANEAMDRGMRGGRVELPSETV